MTVNGHLPSHRWYSSRSLPLALQSGIGIRIMSASMVTLTKGFSITRPAALPILDQLDPSICHFQGSKRSKEWPPTRRRAHRAAVRVL